MVESAKFYLAHIENLSIEVDELPSVSGDKVLLTQLFQSLFSNAIKYRKPEGTLKINIRHADNFVTFEDNGIGLSMEDAEKIFKPMTRVNQIDTEGYGLGLATCKRIAELHGATISAEGVPGEGCKVLIQFPKNLNTP